MEQILDELDTRTMERPHMGLRLFVELAWPILEPATPFVPGYHVDGLCAMLEACARGEVRDVIILIPPRFGKSLLVSVFFPAWLWGPQARPSTKWMFNTYRQDLSLRDSGKRRLLMSSPWYQRRWRDRFTLGQDRFRADSAVRYENDRGGFHLATSVGGGNIGEGGNFLIADDPNNLAEIHSELIRDAVIRWWAEVMSTRRNDASAVRIVVQQRGHERDLAGALIEQGGYTVLCLPNEYDPKRRCFTRWFTDPRTTPGELLCPARVSAEQTAELRVSLGEKAYEAQFQQNAVPPEGGILKRKWWRYWAPLGHPLVGKPDENGNAILPLPPRFARRLHTWDMSFKKTVAGSYVAGMAWGKLQTRAYLLALFRERASFTESLEAVRAMVRDYPAPAIYIEGKANGPAIIDTLQLEIPGLIEADVDTSKEARAEAASVRVQAGNFVLPHPDLEGYSWVEPMRQRLVMFPNGATDDEMDTLTMADRFCFIEQPFTEKRFVQGADHGI